MLISLKEMISPQVAKSFTGNTWKLLEKVVVWIATLTRNPIKTPLNSSFWLVLSQSVSATESENLYEALRDPDVLLQVGERRKQERLQTSWQVIATRNGHRLSTSILHPQKVSSRAANGTSTGQVLQLNEERLLQESSWRSKGVVVDWCFTGYYVHFKTWENYIKLCNVNFWWFSLGWHWLNQCLA